MERFGLSEVQSQAIVDMRLRALTGLEREKLETSIRTDEADQRVKGYSGLIENCFLEVIKEEDN